MASPRLQRFNVQIVNLFHTFHASKLLDFPRHGLDNLLEMYRDYMPDKRHQLADWRIRHFLLFVYDDLRNALLGLGRHHARAPLV